MLQHLQTTWLWVCIWISISIVASFTWFCTRIITTTTTTLFLFFLHSSELQLHTTQSQWDDREPRLPLRLSQLCQLYMGDRGSGAQPDTAGVSRLRPRGGLWYLVCIWWATQPGKPADTVRTAEVTNVHVLVFITACQGFYLTWTLESTIWHLMDISKLLVNVSMWIAI